MSNVSKNKKQRAYEEVPAYQKLVKYYEKAKEVEPYRISDILEKFENEKGFSRKQIYRMNDCLIALDRIRKREDGRYEIYRDWQIFETKEEYDVKLKHSEILLAGIIHRSELAWRDSLFSDKARTIPIITVCSTNVTGAFSVTMGMVNINKYLLQHLEREYPDIYSLYTKIEEDAKKLEEREGEFTEKIRRYFVDRGFEIVEDLQNQHNSKHVSKDIYREVRLLLEKGLESPELKVLENGVILDENTTLIISRNPIIYEEVREAIKEVLGLREVREAFEREKEARTRYNNTLLRFSREVELLALKVLSGEPLKGFCDMCPKVEIGRKEKKIGSSHGESRQRQK
jgi:hypothetical protein